MTAPYINRAFDVMVLASGASKATAIDKALQGTASASECPIRLISPATGRMVWMLDAPAAGMDADEGDDADLDAEGTDEDGRD